MMVYKFMILLLKYWIYILVIQKVIVFFLIHGIRRYVYTRLNKLKRSYKHQIAMEQRRKELEYDTKVLCKLNIFFFKF